MSPRSWRQYRTAEWVRAAFGAKHASNPTQRALRLLEEAIEAYQAAGGPEDMAHKLVVYVFTRPVGDLRQEIGGVGITLLALAACLGIDADDCESVELDRVLEKPLLYFTHRNANKNAAGFDLVTGACGATTVEEN